MNETGWTEGSLEFQREAVARQLFGTVVCDAVATRNVSNTHAKNKTFAPFSSWAG